MIPVKYLEELKTAPIDEVDFVATFIEVSLHVVSRPGSIGWVLTETDVRGQIYYHGQSVNFASSCCQSTAESSFRCVSSWLRDLDCLFIDRGCNSESNLAKPTLCQASSRKSSTLSPTCFPPAKVSHTIQYLQAHAKVVTHRLDSCAGGRDSDPDCGEGLELHVWRDNLIPQQGMGPVVD